MTPTQIEMIRASWASVEPIQDVAATLFYDRLFELDPTVRRLFRGTDMARQRTVLTQTLTVVVKSLDQLDQLVPAVEALGRRHAGHGVREEHYETSAPRSSGHSARVSAMGSRQSSRPPGRTPTQRLPRS
jgi:hemoglobin-like flavoprotein